MKLHCSKILLLFLPLHILVTSYQVHNNNEPHSTARHTPIYTSRVLSEKDIQSSNYNNDEDMKSVKERFDDRTSQRLRKYNERMQDKRQKYKEQRDKNIQEIIEKDKREKSLEQKIEKGCLKCGCALGGVAASVGVFGGLGVYGSKTAAWAAIATAAKAAGIKKGLEVGLTQVIHEVKQLLDAQKWSGIPTIKKLETLTKGISGDNLTFYDIIQCINSNIKGQWGAKIDNDFSLAVNTIAGNRPEQFNSMYGTSVKAVTDAVEEGEGAAIIEAHAEYAHLYSAIGYSVLAILIIVLVMIIIYLVLRYRRKKKMKKKAEYTKLLNQ